MLLFSRFGLNEKVELYHYKAGQPQGIAPSDGKSWQYLTTVVGPLKINKLLR